MESVMPAKVVFEIMLEKLENKMNCIKRMCEAGLNTGTLHV